MSQWFVRQEDVEIGPLDGPDLLDMIREGTVQLNTLVRKNDSAWFEAGTVGGLFEAASEPTKEFYCPQCSTRVDKPPCVCPHCEVRLTYARAIVIAHKIAGFEPKRKPKRGDSVSRWLQRMQTPRND